MKCPCEAVLWCIDDDDFRDAPIFRHYDSNGRMYYYVRPRGAPEQRLLVNHECPFLRHRVPGKRRKLRRRRR